jgi:hypothetical protein
MAQELELLGLPVRFGVPEEERTLLDLYPSRAAARKESSTSPVGRSQGCRRVARDRAPASRARRSGDDTVFVTVP